MVKALSPTPSLPSDFEDRGNSKRKGDELLGILPERRKNPTRITQKSVIKWGRMLLSDNMNGKSIFFKKVTISENTGKFFRVTPSW
jgi:hypothetical protein